MKPFVSGGRSVFVLGLGLLLFAAGFGLAQTFTGLQNLNGTNGAGAETGLARAGQWLYGTTPAGGVSNNGTVFRLQTNGMAFTNLHLFTGGLDGAVPQSGLVLSGPWLYGTAAAGGSQGYGTVFALQTNGGNFTLLYSFTNGSDGAHPQGGLVWSSNVIYGTTVGVGEGYGTVFALNASGGALTNLHTFSGGSDGGYPQGPLVLSGARPQTAGTGGAVESVPGQDHAGNGFAAINPAGEVMQGRKVTAVRSQGEHCAMPGAASAGGAVKPGARQNQGALRIATIGPAAERVEIGEE